jgi:hypothetical protein
MAASRPFDDFLETNSNENCTTRKLNIIKIAPERSAVELIT